MIGRLPSTFYVGRQKSKNHVWKFSALPQHTRILQFEFFLAALVALYLTLVSEWVSEWVSATLELSTQRVTFETWDPSDIWSERCPDKKTKRQNEKRQNYKTTKLQKKWKKTKDKKKILWSQGSFALLQCFSTSLLCSGYPPWLWSLLVSGGKMDHTKYIFSENYNQNLSGWGSV